MIREEEPPRPSTRLTDSTEALAVWRPAADGAGEADEAGARRAGLDRDEGPGEGPHAALRDRQCAWPGTSSGTCATRPWKPARRSAGYRLRKLLRRNKGVVTAAGAVFLVLLAGVGISTWQAVRASLAEGEARQQRDEAVAARQGESRSSGRRPRPTRCQGAARAEAEADEQGEGQWRKRKRNSGAVAEAEKQKCGTGFLTA